MTNKTAYILLPMALSLAACIKIGDIDSSLALPDPDLPYPDYIQNDDAPVSLASPDGYTNIGVIPDDKDPDDGIDPTPEPEQPYVVRNYRLGPPDYANSVRAKGGLTITLVGTGEPVCVAVDPENIQDDDCSYDDGDVDLFIGHKEHYQGVLGESMGFFASTWTDDLGTEHETDTNICLLQIETTESVGKGQPESCAFDTVEGQEYVIALHAFAYPVDDYVLNVGLLVQPGHKGQPICVFTSSDRYLYTTIEGIDESDAAYPDNPYADNRNPCLCPANDAEREECGQL